MTWLNRNKQEYGLFISTDQVCSGEKIKIVDLIFSTLQVIQFLEA